ncbi:unnamed protein product [Rodentolepis nana]|uniref:EF-hand domain-containing protein n=1 Tax=Rodentolepis nana TaxID=102285 RepID=A0A0R3TQE0_RODNA|nr:unnamed protein product [Rodentolepis nana]
MRPEDLMDHEVNAVRKAFRYFDRIGNGRIKTTKLGDCLRWLQLVPTEAQIEALSQSVDPKSTGYINFNAFLEAAAQIWISDQHKEGKIWDAFLHFDKNESGKISFNDLKQVLTEISTEPLPEKETNKILKKFVDSNGMIEYGYIIRAWQK